MREKRALYFTIGALTLFVMGQSPLSLRSDGIGFPDGTVQTTAATDLGTAARQGFNAFCTGMVSSGESFNRCTAFTVPSGKIFVLEAVSGVVDLQPDHLARALLYRTTGTSSAVVKVHYLPMVLVDPGGDIYQIRNSFHRAYFTENQEVVFRVFRIERPGLMTSGAIGFEFTISGYLVDAAP